MTTPQLKQFMPDFSLETKKSFERFTIPSPIEPTNTPLAVAMPELSKTFFVTIPNMVEGCRKGLDNFGPLKLVIVFFLLYFKYWRTTAAIIVFFFIKDQENYGLPNLYKPPVRRSIIPSERERTDGRTCMGDGVC